MFIGLSTAITAALGVTEPSYAIINDGGQLAPYVTFTRSSTATYYGSDGLLKTAAANEPRYDYDPVTLQLRGLLIEEQRTNIVLQSENYADAAWTKSGAIVSGKRISAASTNAIHICYATFTYAANTTITAQIKFGKKTGFAFFQLCFGNASRHKVTINLQTGAVANSAIGGAVATAVVQDFGDKWRITITGQSTYAGVAYFNTGLATALSGETYNAYEEPVFAGNGEFVDMYEPQLEAGAFATSYIPTTTVAVTRAADSAVISSLANIGYNASEGSFFAEAVFPPSRPPVNSFYPVVFQLSSSSGLLNAYMGINMSGAGANWSVYNGTSINQVNIGLGSPSPTALSKFAVCYKQDDFAGVMNGGVVGTDTLGSLGVPVKMMIGCAESGTAGQINSHIRRLRYYPRRLTNAQLVSLTSP